MKPVALILFFSMHIFCRIDNPKIETISLGYHALSPTQQARHIGGKDEELRAPYKVHLHASFTLGLVNGTLVGIISADFKEEDPGPGHKYRGTDNTEFAINQQYEIYRPQPGYKIIEYKILYDKEHTSSFDCWGRENFGTYEDICEFGPLSAITWIGDTGRDQDQIEGCVITPYLRRMEIKVEKINE